MRACFCSRVDSPSGARGITTGWCAGMSPWRACDTCNSPRYRRPWRHAPCSRGPRLDQLLRAKGRSLGRAHTCPRVDSRAPRPTPRHEILRVRHRARTLVRFRARRRAPVLARRTHTHARASAPRLARQGHAVHMLVSKQEATYNRAGRTSSDSNEFASDLSASASLNASPVASLFARFADDGWVALSSSPFLFEDVDVVAPCDANQIAIPPAGASNRVPPTARRCWRAPSAPNQAGSTLPAICPPLCVSAGGEHARRVTYPFHGRVWILLAELGLRRTLLLFARVGDRLGRLLLRSFRFLWVYVSTGDHPACTTRAYVFDSSLRILLSGLRLRLDLPRFNRGVLGFVQLLLKVSTCAQHVGAKTHAWRIAADASFLGVLLLYSNGNRHWRCCLHLMLSTGQHRLRKCCSPMSRPSARQGARRRRDRAHRPARRRVSLCPVMAIDARTPGNRPDALSMVFAAGCVAPAAPPNALSTPSDAAPSCAF